MQTLLPSEFKRGMVLMLDGVPLILDDFHLTGTAQSRHRLHARLRNLKSGRLIDRVFPENERVAVAAMEYRPAQYSYAQGDQYVFLDSQTYDELILSAEQLGDRRGFLKENEEYRALFLEGKLMDIVLPAAVALRVEETAPPQSGGSDAAWKPAKLETGLEVMVPLFIATGETVRVDTTTRKYLGKETGDRK